MNLKERLTETCGKEIIGCSDRELYVALLKLVQEEAARRESNTGKKKVYYISAEFLIGKLLSNNLINLGLYEEVRQVLADHGRDLCRIEETEPEPSLGNGGLGRLAACFLDSMATLGLPGAGIGLNYHMGLFKQEFADGLQKEMPNPWIESENWLTRREVSYPVTFGGGLTVHSRLYDIAVTGYHSGTNQLHLFDIESVDEGIVGEGISFDKQDIARNLTLFLYPDDSDEAGQKLRIYQQYFMVSNGARLILDECESRGGKLTDLPEYAVIQINDTHPSMVIPELIRLLTERGIAFDAAVEIVKKTCAYTNHTILAEALETWPIHYLKEVVPQLVPIIEILDDRIRRANTDLSAAIIDQEDRVHMAHMDIHYGFSVNGVAYLHTEILKKSELKRFYTIYPEKFNNKTNGITFRRWLMHSNHPLTDLIRSKIGAGFETDAMELEKLAAFNDEDTRQQLLAIKQQNKVALKHYLKETQNVDIDENSIYDIQIKRLHEYKRQQMNALYVIHKYQEIKAGKLPVRPITVIFGAKAAPAYVIAKDIIHLILCLQELINHDPEVSPYLKVVMVKNYNVTKAEKLIPACDISEQISLASKEASGTSNMKFMLNGAVTLGTMDGANVEIAELVGPDNIYIFGESSETVIRHYDQKDYAARDYYEQDKEIRAAMDFIVGKEMLKIGHKENLERLYKELLNKDWFMTLLDYQSYAAAKEQAYADYENRMEWAQKMLVNISKAGYFSSDRTIEQYNQEIWHLS